MSLLIGDGQELASPDIIKKRFLDLYMEDPVIKHVVNKIGMARRTFYNWLRDDEEFAKEFKIAQNMMNVFLEDEAYRRAVLGTVKPVFQGGIQVGEITEYSDMLLTLLLKANNPSKYRELKGDVVVNLPEAKIRHVHSVVPISTDESQVDLEYEKPEDIPYEEVKSSDIELLNKV